VVKQGFLQAVGVALYCTLVGTFLWNSNDLFGKANTFFAPIAILTLLSTSVMICGLIVFYKPYKLFFDGKKREAADVVVSTAVSLFVFLILFFGILFLNR